MGWCSKGVHGLTAQCNHRLPGRNALVIRKNELRILVIGVRMFILLEKGGQRLEVALVQVIHGGRRDRLPCRRKTSNGGLEAGAQKQATTYKP